MNKWIRCLFLGAVVAGFGSLRAVALAKNPSLDGPEAFFGLTNLYTLHLIIPADQWQAMESYESPLAGSPPGMDIDFKEGHATLEFEGKRWGDLKVRFKGNSSFRSARNSIKRPLKLDFNDIDKGRKFFGLTKLNLNNNAMDPVQIREALAYDVVRAAGIPAARTAFAKVYLTVPGKYNRVCAGLYTVVEQVDERFLKTHFDTKQGLLLKPERVRGLPYAGDTWAAYEKQMQPKTKVEKTESDRCIQFFKLVNQADDATFNQESASYMEVDQFLRFLALETALANLDSPLLTGHNYYLFLHPTQGKFYWIPWDLNEAFGGFPMGGTAAEQVELSVERPYATGNRLAERTLAMLGARERFQVILRGLVATNFTTTRLFPLIDGMAAVVRPVLVDDPTVTPAQFDRALEGELSTTAVFPRPPGPGMVRQLPPLKTFIAKRIESLQGQLDGARKGYEPRQNFNPPGRMGPGGPGSPKSR